MDRFDKIVFRFPKDRADWIKIFIIRSVNSGNWKALFILVSRYPEIYKTVDMKELFETAKLGGHLDMELYFSSLIKN